MRKKELIIPTLSFALMMSAGMTANTVTPVYAENIVSKVNTTTIQETNQLNHKSKQTIKKLNKTMYATTAVNVRNKPSSKGKKLGTLRFAQKVKVTGQDKNTGWYQIKYKGKVGYVSGAYLSTNKPSTSTGSGSSTWKPSSGSTSKPSSGSTSKPSSGSSNSNKGSGSSSGSTSKPSTGKPSTSKPSGSDGLPEYVDCDYSDGSWSDGKYNGSGGTGW